ncbi:MAG: alanine--tRNA ligase [Bacteriovoracaceae bacterium]|nr:alanine--tRNA ligase [Bacteriovoracaceae bacterium]
MRAQEIRNIFSDYFRRQGHDKHKSSSLVPHNDNTLLFANAGMNQFKDFFTGKAVPSNRRAVTIQKCVRAGGKHNDLENVGFTARHHTYFEMMGNFSFGDYFKKDAIKFAWELLTVELKIPKEKLRVTVHESDDEALMIWHKEMGVPLEWIYKLGDKSNFWEMGDVGPCGPCTEIFFDHGEAKSTGTPAGCQEIDDEGRFVEIWNLVFMQFEKYREGDEIKRKPLPKPSVDTGGGLERFAAALQGKYFNYDTDLFEPIMNSIGKLSGKNYYTTKSEDEKSSFRVVADHIRSSTMLITDGVIPSNDGRGYVLRRIIRRAVRHLELLGIKEISFYKLVPSVFESLGQEYPDNASNAALAEKLLKLEEEKFRKTLSTGLELIKTELAALKPGQAFSGDVAFRLYDTFGFPLDLTEVILREKNLTLDTKAFDEAMAKQRELSKKGGKFKVQEDNLKLFYSIKEKNGETQFTGYTETSSKAKLIAKEEINGVYHLIFDRTPFYGEGGGQVGDTGEVFGKEGKLATITDTQKPVDGLHDHLSEDADALELGGEYELKVNRELRELTKRNHSATHLLQSALIKVLGSHIKQAGSSVGPDRLRFDFTHNEALKPSEITQVEELVNQAISRRLTVNADVMSKDQATQKGAMALFGEKYGDQVRVLTMGDFSIELCGGTHVSNTGDIGAFKIVVETSLASGVRRIEAITSTTAMEWLLKRSSLLSELEKEFGAKEEKVLEKISALQLENKNKAKMIEQLQEQAMAASVGNLFKPSGKIGTCEFYMADASSQDVSGLKKLADLFSDKYSSGIALITHTDGERTTVVLKSPRDSKEFDCGKTLKELLPLMEGRGGGKPDMAQGSGLSSKSALFITAIKKMVK